MADEFEVGTCRGVAQGGPRASVSYRGRATKRPSVSAATLRASSKSSTPRPAQGNCG